jgi:hypothetical protein
MRVEEVVAVARDVDVLTETVIRRPVAEVAAFAGDPANAPEWYANIDSVEWRTPPPMVAGSCLAFVARFLGRRLAYTYEVAELVPGERLVMRTADGPFSDGDHLHLGTAGRRRYPDDAAQPGPVRRFLRRRGAVHGRGDAPGEPKDLAALRNRLERTG